MNDRQLAHWSNFRTNEKNFNKYIWGKRREFRELVRGHIPPRGAIKGMVTVNVGCGPLPLRFNSREEIVVDPLMSNYREMYPRRHTRGMVVLSERIEETSVRSRHADLVYCKKTLEYIHEWEAALGEMHRILKRGGHLVLIYHSYQSDGINLILLHNIDMKDHLRTLGFDVLRFEADGSTYTKVLGRKR